MVLYFSIINWCLLLDCVKSITVGTVMTRYNSFEDILVKKLDDLFLSDKCWLTGLLYYKPRYEKCRAFLSCLVYLYPDRNLNNFRTIYLIGCLRVFVRIKLRNFCLYDSNPLFRGFFWPLDHKTSVTRFCHFGEIIDVWYIFECLFRTGHNCEPTLANIFCYWANFLWYKCLNIVQKIYPYGHTAAQNNTLWQMMSYFQSHTLSKKPLKRLTPLSRRSKEATPVTTRTLTWGRRRPSITSSSTTKMARANSKDRTQIKMEKNSGRTRQETDARSTTVFRVVEFYDVFSCPLYHDFFGYSVQHLV